jgi:hypothetical protein
MRSACGRRASSSSTDDSLLKPPAIAGDKRMHGVAVSLRHRPPLPHHICQHGVVRPESKGLGSNWHRRVEMLLAMITAAAKAAVAASDLEAS